MDTTTLPALLQLLAVTVALVLFAVGLYASIRDLTYTGSDDPVEREAYSKSAFKKSVIFILCGIGVFALARFAQIISQPETAGVGAILQAVWEAIRDRSFLLLIPILIRLWKKNSAGK